MLNATDLRCEYLVNPLGIDVIQPRLSWRLASDERSVLQNSYQILVADSRDALDADTGNCWDTGRVESEQSIHHPYTGVPLRARTRYFWKVRVWDQNGQPSDWSDVATWEMGLLHPSNWRAEWITPAWEEEKTTSQPSPLLRTEFTVDSKVSSARLYVTSLGLYHVELNGARVGDWLFTPGWTSYSKHLPYQTYDVTHLLHDGVNALGAMLGDGWYRGYIGWKGRRNVYGDQLALLAQLHITYADGREQVVITDGTWKAATGAILASDLYNGETYDARLERPGWNAAGYDESDWQRVHRLPHPKHMLVAQSHPPVRAVETLHPLAIFKSPSGCTLVDMGQVMTGRVRITMRGAAGQVVTLRHGEVLDQHGELYTANLRTAKQTVSYTLKGADEETYEPHFTFQGFRYVQVDGYPGELTPNAIEGVVIYSDMPQTGTFECSNPLINQLQQNIVWSQKGNFLDVPTDCPQRDERFGWTADAQVFIRTASFNMEVATFFTKWLRDLAADQTDEGRVAFVIPDILIDEGGTAAWGDAATICPWTLYLCYGDSRILEAQYKSMKGWVTYMLSRADMHLIWRDALFGDWLAIASPSDRFPYDVTETDLIATAFFAHSTQLLYRAAQVLGYEDDAAQYGSLARAIRAAFCKEFVTPSGRLTSNTQTGYVLALMFDLLPEAQRPEAARRLEEEVRRHDLHISTGFVGTPYLLHVLSRFGYTDIAYALLLQETCPSWLYPISKGATTIWERWDGIKPDGSFQDETMNSFNHYAYGAVGEWLYRVVAGIDLDPEAPGYKHILIQPQPGGDLTFAKATYQSLYGEIVSSWTLDDDSFRLFVTIPANTRATIRLPHAHLEQVRHRGEPLSRATSLHEARQDGQDVIVMVGSGQYDFAYAMERSEAMVQA
jgi:alpha-L-rhamnosidase